MRIALLAIAFLLGTAQLAMADARILSVEDDGAPQEATPAPPPEAAPAPAPVMPHEPQQGPQPATPPAVQAEQPPPASPPPALPPRSRFTFKRANDGFLRLDGETGQVAYCAARTTGWTCEAVPEERAAFEKEIGRLQDEVAALKREVAALREPPPPPPRPPAELAPPPAAKERDKGGDLTIKLPSQEDIDRATAALHHAWERLVDMIGNLKKDLTRKGQPDRTTL